MDNYEQKYKNALSWMQSLYKGLHGKTKEEAETYFPELKESEDERIRKRIIALVNAHGQGMYKDEMIAWLEKQGERKEATCVAEIIDHLTEKEQEILFKELEMQKEQKPKWSEEDKNMLKWVTGYLDNKMLNTPIVEERTACKDAIAWLEKLKDEQKPNYCHHEVDLSGCSEEYCKAYYDGWNNCNQQHAQLEAEQKPAWSEEDIVAIDCAVEVLSKDLPSLAASIERLKYLRPQNTWKPSDEQMKQLEWIAKQNKDNILGKDLMSLYQDLKNLKDEK